MKNLKDTCIDFFTDENLKKDVREMMKPIFSMIYNEMYIYIWIIAFYNLFITIIMLSMYIILRKLLHKHQLKQNLLAHLCFHPK
jgi:hypothetical protein